MGILKALTDEEKIIIENWITAHAGPNPNEVIKREQRCSVDYLLRHWAYEKENLFHMFGEKLILEEKISYVESEKELAHKIGKELENIHSSMAIFKMNFFDYLSMTSNASLIQHRYYFIDLLNEKSLAKNIYDGASFSIEDSKGTILKIESGCKPVKVLGKIAKMFGIEGYEDFRIAHSQILNTAKITGTLCLSIHPLDYMTLSDNTSDWSSCMSWEDGCHRQGTVEMMNSPNVVVAYIKSNKSMPMPGGGEWNNKKWRELFIVDDKIITEIKPYPYVNPTITKIVLERLKAMAGSEKYEKNIHIHNGSLSIEEGFKRNLGFECCYMYNDFGALDDGHRCYLSKDFRGECPVDLKYYREEINYSGISQCIWCGENITDDDYYNDEYEGALICHSCYEGHYCAECGRWTSEVYYLDDDENCKHPYCPYCWDEYTSTDPVDGGRYHNDNFGNVYIVPDFMRDGDTILHNWYNHYWVFTTTQYENLKNFNVVKENAEILDLQLEIEHWSFWGSDSAKYSYEPVVGIRISDMTPLGIDNLIHESPAYIKKNQAQFYDHLEKGFIAISRGDGSSEKAITDTPIFNKIKEVMKKTTESNFITIDSFGDFQNAIAKFSIR